MTTSSPSIWHYVVTVKWAVKISSIFVAFLEYTNFKETDEKEWLDPFLGLYFWLHLLLFHHYFSSLIFVIWSADNDNIDNGLGSFSLIKVHIFWEGDKTLRNLHLTFLAFSEHIDFKTEMRYNICSCRCVCVFLGRCLIV